MALVLECRATFINCSSNDGVFVCRRSTSAPSRTRSGHPNAAGGLGSDRLQSNYLQHLQDALNSQPSRSGSEGEAGRAGDAEGEEAPTALLSDLLSTQWKRVVSPGEESMASVSTHDPREDLAAQSAFNPENLPPWSRRPSPGETSCASSGGFGDFCADQADFLDEVMPQVMPQVVPDEGASSAPPRSTSLMICNIPCRTTQKQLAAAVDSLGFAGKYDFLYIPRARGGSSPSIGYGFVNLFSPEDVHSFTSAITGYKFEGSQSAKRCVVKPARLHPAARSGSRKNCWVMSQQSGQHSAPL